MAYKLVLVLGFLILLAACGGDSGPTQDALKSRGEAVADAINDGKWAKVYTLFSPESKAVCDGAEFAVAANLGFSTLKIFLGVEDSDNLEFKVETVAASGINGQVTMDLYLDGDLFSEGYAEDWIYVDNNWWFVSEAEDCGFSTDDSNESANAEWDAIQHILRKRIIAGPGPLVATLEHGHWRNINE